MVARSVLALRLRHAGLPAQLITRRSLASTAPLLKQKTVQVTPKSAPAQPHIPPSAPSTSSPKPTDSWLTRIVKQSPTAMKLFVATVGAMGYNSPKQVAGRRAFVVYEQLCVQKAQEDREFWLDECSLPPTFQSWFSITNLHIWMLTVRFRALPDGVGKHYIQGLLDHFFIDVEDRVRAILQPAKPPKTGPVPPAPQSTYTPHTPFYTVANAETRPKGSAPERLVTRQMKIMKEQWAGMGLNLDLGLIRSDAELAAAVWRNFLGARGARGIVYPSSPEAKAGNYYRRSVNLVGGEIEKVAKIDEKGLEVEEARDDGSGVHDFAPNDAGKYVAYPELMADIVRYIRRELVRLENIPDEKIMTQDKAGIDVLRFGRVSE